MYDRIYFRNERSVLVWLAVLGNFITCSDIDTNSCGTVLTRLTAERKSMTKKKMTGFAVCFNTLQGRLKMFERNLPIYWLRSVAENIALRHGNCQVREVEIKFIEPSAKDPLKKLLVD